jgi:hypothetical protein
MAKFQGASQAATLDLDPGLRDYWVTGHFATLEASAAIPTRPA